MKRFIALVIFFVMQFTSVFAFWDADDDEVVVIDNIVEVVNNALEKPNIHATSAILFDRTSKRVLFEKNMDKKIPNASTTKILTAIVAYENGNMEDIVTISSLAANTGGSRIKFRTGDKITLNDLMIGLLLRSGNDAAVAIAEHIGGNVEDFCQMMNEKAKEIGAINTNFTSPHGLDDENHYSTAYDLAIIADYALNIPVIANIVSRKSAVIKINDYSKEIYTTNEMLSYYEGADGVKTGYTGNAGRCLVTSATKNDWQLISVVLGCNTKKQRTVESTALLNYGFQKFTLVDLCENMPKEFAFSVNKAKMDSYKATINTKYVYPVSNEEIGKIHYFYDFDENLEATIAAGTAVGDIRVMIGDEVICYLNVKTSDKIQRKSMIDFFWEIFNFLLIFC